MKDHNGLLGSAMRYSAEANSIVDTVDIEGVVTAMHSGRTPPTEVDVRSLSLGETPRALGVRPSHVQALAEVFEVLPPIMVNRRNLHVVDGAHRLHAARSRGMEKIAVYFCDVPVDQEFALAVACNSVHGLALSLDERRKAADRLVASHASWSDRRIARIVGLSPSTVGVIRRRRGVSDGLATRVGDDGRQRPVDPVARRRHAAEVLSSDPSLSLRKVSALCGISPATALDVRNSLAGGTPDRRPPHAAGVGQGLDSPPGNVQGAVRGFSAEDALAVLRRDPSMRYSESGRIVLRLLEMNLVGDQRHEQLSATLPDHCLDTVARIARLIADQWARFADRAESRAPD